MHAHSSHWYVVLLLDCTFLSPQTKEFASCTASASSTETSNPRTSSLRRLTQTRYVLMYELSLGTRPLYQTLVQGSGFETSMNYKIRDILKVSGPQSLSLHNIYPPLRRCGSLIVHTFAHLFPLISQVVYKLTDFGYAKSYDKSSVCTSLVGTVQYVVRVCMVNRVLRLFPAL